MKKLVFLGGTVGNNNWRDILIQSLSQSNIDISQLFNPIVANWNEAAQINEDAVKKIATHFVFYLADSSQKGNSISAYSMVEAMIALQDNLDKTILVFDEDGLAGHALKVMKKVQKILKERFPTSKIFTSQSELLNYLKLELN